MEDAIKYALTQMAATHVLAKMVIICNSTALTALVSLTSQKNPHCC